MLSKYDCRLWLKNEHGCWFVITEDCIYKGLLFKVAEQ